MRRFWTKEELDYLRKNFPDNPTKIIAEKLNRSEKSVSSQANVLGLKKSEEYIKKINYIRIEKCIEKGKKTRFQKGKKPWNAGIKMTNEQKSKLKGLFKPGHIPATAKKNGDISLRRDGSGITYLYIRIDVGKWELLHRRIWEKHNGPIPENCNIIFKNRDRFDFSIYNLECITNAELMKRNSIHRFPNDLKKSIILTSKLKKEIFKQLNTKQNGKI